MRQCVQSLLDNVEVEIRAYRNKLKKAFRAQRANARQRGIKFDFTFAWWVIAWGASGRLYQRGKGYNKYVMARYNDIGPYNIDNVKFILGPKNCSEAHLGKPETSRSKERNRQGQLGRKHSKETRLKMSLSAKLAKKRQRDLAQLAVANFFEINSVKETSSTSAAVYEQRRQRLAERRQTKG